MADTTEKKTYLVNIESNLKKYSEDAAAAAKEVEKLTIENVKLKGSTTATAAEIEANNAALRNANKEYNQAKKMVDLQTAANKGEAGSRKQLGEILALQMQALGKLGNAYITNAQGVRVLNPLYVEQRKRIGETKQAIIDYDKALNDGRSNVGRYGEAIKASFAQAGSSIQSTITHLFSFATVVAIATKAVQELKEAFLSTDQGIGMLKRWTEGSKTFFQSVIKTIKGEDFNFKNNMLSADAAVKELEKLRIRERTEIVVTAAMQNEVKLIRLKAAGVTDLKEQLKLYEEADKIENERIAIKTEHLQDEIRWKQVIWQQTKDATTADEIAAAQAELVAISGEKNIWIQTKMAAGKAKILDAERIANEKAQEKIKKQNDDNLKWSEDLYKSVEEVHDTALKAKKAADEKAAEDKIDSDKKAAEREKESIAAGFEYQRLKAGENVDALQTILNAEYGAMLASVEYKDMTTNEKLLIDQQYTENTRQLSDLRIQQQTQELDLVANIFGSMSGLFAKQTGAAKAMSIAQALISTYTAGVKAMAELPLGSGPVLRFLTLASVIAAGLLQVKNIMAVKIPGGDSGGSMPTAISSSAPAQRTFAQAQGSSVLTQVQLSQPQLNALPNQNMLTAADIANAIRNMPTPVVTVEDINVKVKSMNKVAVRANI